MPQKSFAVLQYVEGTSEEISRALQQCTQSNVHFNLACIISPGRALQNCVVLSSKFVHVTVSISGINYLLIMVVHCS